MKKQPFSCSIISFSILSISFIIYMNIMLKSSSDTDFPVHVSHFAIRYPILFVSIVKGGLFYPMFEFATFWPLSQVFCVLFKFSLFLSVSILFIMWEMYRSSRSYVIVFLIWNKSVDLKIRGPSIPYESSK